MIDEENDAYMAYMLRLWRAGENEKSAWRASVESPHTGERQAFADLETLFAFLQERTHGVLGVDQQIETDRPDVPSQPFEQSIEKTERGEK
jgi:hypothetical protein